MKNSCQSSVQVTAEGTFLILAQMKTIFPTGYVTQADVDTITYTLTDLTNPTSTVVGPVHLAIENVVFDDLQTGNGWTLDTIGFNFAYKTEVQQPGHSYELAIKIVLLNADKIIIKCVVDAV